MTPRSLTPARLSSFIALSLLSMLAATGHAAAVERGGYSLDILVDGVPIREYFARDKTYVEAWKGREYSVRLTNHTGERVAIALSVDGLNSIDAKTTTVREASKWILEPYETITLDGWQTSSKTARRFFFTTEEASYGAWLGRSKNLGVVAAAVFREKRVTQFSQREGDAGARSQALPSAPQKDVMAKRSRSDDLAATGIGREIGHSVRTVAFDEEDSPTAIVEIRYEYRDALARLGVFPTPCPGCEDPLARRERAHGFEDPTFAPDPFCRRAR